LKAFHKNVSIVKPLQSHTDPILELEYTPAAPDFTIRTIIAAISSAQSPPFNVSIYHPPTLEERVRKMQSAEMKSLLLRLEFSVIVAIPTFIIGIVYMTLVPDTNPTRMYLMEPMWGGMASRSEWSLFFMATPVMFYSAGVFHRRSIKEITALWGKTSRTPVWKRLVRFGSMNLLVRLPEYFISSDLIISRFLARFLWPILHQSLCSRYRRRRNPQMIMSWARLQRTSTLSSCSLCF
jgi:Cu+-exporting ATPase